MYETFLEIVATARKKSRDEIHAVAEGHVWTGKKALEIGLVDGLGGMQEAFQRAREACGKPVDDELVLIRARGEQSRPSPFDPPPEKAAQFPLAWIEALAPTADLAVLHELWLLATTSTARLRALAYLPLRFD
jgi:ClpP class serine protease